MISPEILNKSSALTTGERENMERHCELGYIKLKEAGCFNDCVLQGILDHHERLDGTGYSKGKKEEEISSYSKVIMIADVYDAMVSDRVYRKRIEKGIVCEYLFGNAGRKFCGEYIKSFINSTLFLDLDYIVMEVVGYIIEDSLNDVVSFS